VILDRVSMRNWPRPSNVSFLHDSRLAPCRSRAFFRDYATSSKPASRAGGWTGVVRTLDSILFGYKLRRTGMD
jgi:hypothetical protein